MDFLNHSWYREMQANLHPAFLTSYKVRQTTSSSSQARMVAVGWVEEERLHR